MDSFVGAVCALASEPREEARKAANAYLEALQESPDALHVCATALAQPGHDALAALSESHRETVLFFAALILHNVVRNNAKCGALSGDAWSALSQLCARLAETAESGWSSLSKRRVLSLIAAVAIRDFVPSSLDCLQFDRGSVPREPGLLSHILQTCRQPGLLVTVLTHCVEELEMLSSPRQHHGSDDDTLGDDMHDRADRPVATRHGRCADRDDVATVLRTLLNAVLPSLLAASSTYSEVHVPLCELLLTWSGSSVMCRNNSRFRLRFHEVWNEDVARFMLAAWTRPECENSVTAFWEELLSEPTIGNLQTVDELTLGVLWKQCQNILEFAQFILRMAESSIPGWFASIAVEVLTSHSCVVLTASHPINLCELKGVACDPSISVVTEIGGKFVEWMAGVLALSPSSVGHLRVMDDVLQLWFGLFADMTDAHPALKASYDKKAGEALARSIVLLAHMFSNPSRDDDINTERKRVTRAIIDAFQSCCAHWPGVSACVSAIQTTLTTSSSLPIDMSFTLQAVLTTAKAVVDVWTSSLDFDDADDFEECPIALGFVSARTLSSTQRTLQQLSHILSDIFSSLSRAVGGGVSVRPQLWQATFSLVSSLAPSFAHTPEVIKSYFQAVQSVSPGLLMAARTVEDWTAVAEAFQTLTALADTQLTLTFPSGSAEPKSDAMLALQWMAQSSVAMVSWSSVASPSPIQLHMLQHLSTHFMYLTSFFRFFGLTTGVHDASTSGGNIVTTVVESLLFPTPSHEEALSRIVVLKYYLAGSGIASMVPSLSPHVGSVLSETWKLLAEMCLFIAPHSSEARRVTSNLASTIFDQFSVLAGVPNAVLQLSLDVFSTSLRANDPCPDTLRTVTLVLTHEYSPEVWSAIVQRAVIPVLSASISAIGLQLSLTPEGSPVCACTSVFPFDSSVCYQVLHIVSLALTNESLEPSFLVPFPLASPLPDSSVCSLAILSHVMAATDDVSSAAAVYHHSSVGYVAVVALAGIVASGCHGLTRKAITAVKTLLSGLLGCRRLQHVITACAPLLGTSCALGLCQRTAAGMTGSAAIISECIVSMVKSQAVAITAFEVTFQRVLISIPSCSGPPEAVQQLSTSLFSAVKVLSQHSFQSVTHSAGLALTGTQSIVAFLDHVTRVSKRVNGQARVFRTVTPQLTTEDDAVIDVG